MTRLARATVLSTLFATFAAVVLAQQPAPANPTPVQAAQSTGGDVETTQLYDLRDMLTLAPMLDEHGDSKLNDFIGRISAGMSSEPVPVIEGVYSLTVTNSAHEKFRKSLTDLRAMFADRYELTVATFTTGAGSAPAIGDVCAGTTPDSLQRAVVSRRTNFCISSTTEYTTVKELVPCVAENATGYSATLETVTDGLELWALVGADAEDAKGTTLRLTGSLNYVTLDRGTGPAGGAPGAAWRLDLPRVQTRTIQSNVRLEFGKLTVVAVLVGKEPGNSTVIAASVRKLPD